MSEGRPHLRALPGEKAAGEARPEPERGAPGRGRIGLVLLAAVAAVCALGWLFEVRESRALRAELETRQAELAAARTEIEARRAHLQGARERASAVAGEAAALVERLQDLSGWLADAPAAGSGEGRAGEASDPRPASEGAGEAAPAAPFEGP